MNKRITSAITPATQKITINLLTILLRTIRKNTMEKKTNSMIAEKLRTIGACSLAKLNRKLARKDQRA
ncbi:MAG TPA: hypothetical protein VKR32_03985 [Puia sp.]|nr:hypothetical protein [Puia sp.]